MGKVPHTPAPPCITLATSLAGAVLPDQSGLGLPVVTFKGLQQLPNNAKRTNNQRNQCEAAKKKFSHSGLSLFTQNLPIKAGLFRTRLPQ
jgi:hypothetical protein